MPDGFSYHTGVIQIRANRTLPGLSTTRARLSRLECLTDLVIREYSDVFIAAGTSPARLEGGITTRSLNHKDRVVIQLLFNAMNPLPFAESMEAILGPKARVTLFVTE